MCGIFGVIATDRDTLLESHRQADHLITSMRHRGPDDQGLSVTEHALLGMVRLSIIDTTHGRQPIYSHCGRYILVFNGEIYNYLELREEMAGKIAFDTRSDSEVIMRAFELYGHAAFSKLNGMFGIALYDTEHRRVYLYRDRAGEKPIYYWLDSNNQTIAFASEIKTLFALPFVNKELANDSLVGLMTFNYVPGQKTIYKNIMQVEPGHCLSFGLHDPVKQESFWDLSHLSNAAPPSFDHDTWSEEFYRLFDSAVEIRLRSDVPLAAFLSSGTDSNAVVWTIKKRLNMAIDAITVGFKNSAYDESAIAMRSGAELGVPVTTFYNNESSVEMLPKILHFLDQPHGDASFIPFYELCANAAQKVKVVLTGDGSDEIFGGYPKYFAFARYLAEGMHERDALRRYFQDSAVFSLTDLQALLGQEATPLYEEAFAAFLKLYEQYPFLDPQNKLLYAEFKLLLPGNNLVKPDRMGMAHSIELRAPFLDHRLIEHSFLMPGRLKFDQKETKIGLRQTLTKLLPEYLIGRNKMALTVPIGDWYKTSLRSYVTKTLEPSRAMFTTGLVKAEAATAMINEHMQGEKNRTRELRLLIAMAEWMELHQFAGQGARI